MVSYLFSERIRLYIGLKVSEKVWISNPYKFALVLITDE